MADISITAANVISGDAAIRESGVAGEALTAGKWAYQGADRKWYLADSNAGTEIQRKAKGVVLNGAAAGQPVVIHKEGPITIGGTLVPGVAYYLSDTPVGMCPVADVGSGEYSCILGIAKSATVLDVKIQYSGVSL